MASEIKHAWHSAKGEQWMGNVIYRHAETGLPVSCTLVSTSAEDHGSGFDDITYVGPVDKWLGQDEKRRSHNESSRRGLGLKRW